MNLIARLVPAETARQRLDLQADRLDPVLGQSGAVGDDDCDRLAGIAHALCGDNRLTERLGRRRSLQPQRDTGQGADLGCGDDRVDAGDRQCRRDLDAADAAVRDRAAQDCGVQHAGAHEIADIFAAAAQKAQVLDPLDRAADVPVEDHGFSPLR
jgi:hypothetical protein